MKRVSLCLLALWTYAEGVGCSAPNLDIEVIVSQIQEKLHKSCDQSADLSVVKEVIRTTFMPHVDSSVMTKQVLGRKYWLESEPEDQEALQRLLEILLIKQYAEAFNCEYRDNRMEFLPVRGNLKRYSRVDSNIYFEGNESVSVKYSVRCDETEWKILDIVIDGLSIVQTYRSQFNRLLSTGGIKALNNYLASKLVN